MGEEDREMKRHQVMDLFWGSSSEEIGEWNHIKDSLPQPKSNGMKVKVKLDDGTQKYAYFYKDKALWIEKYGMKPSYFWDCRTKDPIFNVEEWKEIKKENDDH